MQANKIEHCSTAGNLWIAVYASQRVMCFDPQGKHLTDIVFSANNMTCTTWGGQDYDTLYVTSARDSSSGATVGDEGGQMFKYKPIGAKGPAKFEFGG